jgi:hypothetical protein
MKTDAQQRRYAPLFRAAYAHRYVAVAGYQRLWQYGNNLEA